MTTQSNSEQSRLERALANSEGFCQVLLDSALDCIVCTDENAGITEFNAAAVRTFRITRQEALGQNWLELLLPLGAREDCRRQLLATTDGAEVTLVANRIETVAVRSDGKEFPAEFTLTRVHNDHKVTFVARVRDITARRKAEEALLWLAAIVESSQDAVIGKNLEGTVISWNKGAEAMYGYAADEIIGQSITCLVPPGRKNEVAHILEQLKMGCQIKQFETIRVSKDGRLLNVSLSISPVQDTTGRIIGASAIARDITAEKCAQEALRKATETSIYSSPVPIVAVDTNRRVTIWNRAAEEVFGWSEQELMGKPLPFIPPDEAEQAKRLHSRLLAGETLTGIEVRRQKKDGSLVTVSISANPLWDEHHKVKGIIGFLNDMTERKNAEEALRRAEEKYRSIFENAVEGIYQATLDGKYLSANPALARMLGFDSPQQLIESRDDIPQQEYINPHQRSNFIKAVHENGIVKNFEYEAYRQDGKKVWLTASARAVCDATGKIRYLEGTVQDITERRELEQQVRQMQKIEAIGRLAGGVAHDFNNILMAISSYTELLERKTTEDAPRRYVNEIANAVNRGSALTQGLLTFSRKQLTSPKILDLNELIARQMEMLKRLIPENIVLNFAPGSQIGNVRADPSQIEQAVMNLVINARDAMPSGGTVLVETQRAQLDSEDLETSDSADLRDCVLLSVTDNGCGMDAETKSHLFEPFYTTKEQGKGTGLGLATVFGVVKQSSGHITVWSEPDNGTIFKIFLPRVNEVPVPERLDEPVESATNGETILLVEDETAVREPAAEYLSQCGYKVLKAANGQQALDLVHKYNGRIDLLLTDIVMPKMSGVELSEKISSIHPETRVAFMSGYSRDLLSNRELQPNCVLLKKPFQLKALGQCIRQVLDRKSAAASHS
jgi:two-component system, cell cycle sensor histidine kinase and response regulator CckA